MLAIPQFYKRKDAGAVPQSQSLVNPQDFRRLARVMFMKRKAEEANLEDEDFRLLLGKMVELSEPADGSSTLEGKTMTFEQFISLSKSEEIHAIFRKQLFTPMNYFAFPKTIDGLIYSDCVFSCAAEMREQRRIRYDLALVDKENTGYLTEMQLVQYFDPFMREVPNDHLDFYIAVVVRKFMFFLERDKRVSIRDFMSSPILSEFKQRYKSDENWFNSKNIYGLYNKFMELDEDRNMFLSRQEFIRLSLDRSPLPRITPLIVERVFQRKIVPTEDNPNGELDFRNFLDFILAFQSKSHPASIKYFWELLDMNELGYLTVADIRELVREVFETLTEDTLRLYAGGSVNVEDVKDEIFDMANAGSSVYITFDDLIKSGHGATIVSLLTDPSGFLTYEQREYALQSQRDQDATPDENDYAEAAENIFGSGEGTADGYEMEADSHVIANEEGLLFPSDHHQPDVESEPEDYV